MGIIEGEQREKEQRAYSNKYSMRISQVYGKSRIFKFKANRTPNYLNLKKAFSKIHFIKIVKS